MSVWQKKNPSEGNKNENKNRDITNHFQNQFRITVTCTVILYKSLWQKVLPLNPGMFVYSYLFSSYYSYTKLWLLLFSMHWWVVKVKIGSFGRQED